MVLLGAYTKGTDKQLDKAILCREQIRDYISQDMNHCVKQEESLSKLRELAAILEA